MNKSSNFIAVLFTMCVANLVWTSQVEGPTCKEKLCNKEDDKPPTYSSPSLFPHNAEESKHTSTSSLGDQNEYTTTINEKKYDVQSMNTKKWEDGVIASINIACFNSELTLAANELNNDVLDLTNVQQKGVLKQSRLRSAVSHLNSETWKLFNIASKNMAKVTSLMIEYSRGMNSYARKIASGASIRLMAKVLPIVVDMMKAHTAQSMKLIDEIKKESDKTKSLMFAIDDALTGQKYKYAKDIFAKMKIEMKKLEELYSSMRVLLQQLSDGIDLHTTAYLENMEDNSISKTERHQNSHKKLNKLRIISGSVAFVTTIYHEILNKYVKTTLSRQLSLAVVSKKDVNEFRDKLAETCKKSVDTSKSMMELRKAKLFNN